MFSSWTGDVRWTKLRQFDSSDGETRKVVPHTASDDSDEEWLAQLERDYAASNRKRYRGKCTFIERCLITALSITIVITIILASVMIARKYGPSIQFIDRPKTLECESKGCISAAYSVINKIDEQIKPCDDFYQYVCGKWVRDSFVPSGFKKYTSFHQVAEQNEGKLKAILDRSDLTMNESAKVIDKVKNFYTACLNKTKIDLAGNEPIFKLIKDVGSWPLTGGTSWSAESWNFEQALSAMHKLQSTPLFYMFVSSDDRNSSENIIQIQQAGISLSDREYYLKNESYKIANGYKAFMRKIAIMLGADENTTKVQMEEVFEFEKKLAEVYEPKLRDSESAYHRMTMEDLQQLAPAIPWMDYMNNIFSTPVSHDEPVVVYTPTFLKNMSELVIRTDRRILANYMVWHLIKPLLSELPKPFKDASLDFLRIEQGIEGGAPTWKTCITKTDKVMGFATGYLYTKTHEGKKVKDEAEQMIRYIKESFITNLDDIKWMDKDTKKLARQKADEVVHMIGYPEWIANPEKLDKYYENLTVSPDDSFENLLNARRFYHQRSMDRRGKEIDRKEWHMTPTAVNAYYNAPNNYIAFPSGILQQPFFDSEFPRAVNYGAIGVIMGHELTHGFDDKGRKFNKNGNIESWWKNESAVAFKERSSCMVDQYANYTVAGQRVNGNQTLSENIADNGGLKLAYKAYQKWISDHGNESKLPGLDMTSDQLFFVGFAQVWCVSSNKESIRNALLTDIHSPEKIRVQAAVSNSREFAKAFKCPADSPMNPARKCEVW